MSNSFSLRYTIFTWHNWRHNYKETRYTSSHSLRMTRIARLNLILGRYTCQNLQLWNRSSHLSACQTFILYASNRETCRGGSNWRKKKQHTKDNNLEHSPPTRYALWSWGEVNQIVSVPKIYVQLLLLFSVGWVQSVRYKDNDSRGIWTICRKRRNCRLRFKRTNRP